MSNSNTMYSIDYQRSIIQLLCINLKFFNDYGSFIKEDYFELQPTRTIFTIISKHILTYEKELDCSDLIVKIDEYVTQKAYSNDTFILLKDEVREIFKVYVKNEQWLIDSLTSFCRRQELINAIHKSIDMLSKDPENSYEKVLKEIDNAVSVGMGGNEGLNFGDLHNLIELRKKRYAPEKLFRTGIPAFDEACEGGLAAGEIHVILGSPKAGKSTFAANIGAHGLISGKTVFHASLEISDIDVANKYAIRLTGMTYNEMNNIKEAVYKERIKSFEKYKPKLFINHWPEGSANTLNIRSWISKMKSKHNVNPDILILDYDDPLVGETKIPLLDGTEVEIKDLIGRKEFCLYACKQDGTVVPGRGHSARISREVSELIELTLDNGKTIRSTINHHHMLRDGTYKRADEFLPGDSMMPLYRTTKNQYEYVRCIDVLPFLKVIAVKIIKLETPIPVYCLTVDDYENYALSAGVFTHNCLSPIRGSKDDLYGDAGEIYKDLINLANLFKIPILTFAQPQREAWELPNRFELMRSYHISHSARKIHRAFSISSLNFADDAKTGILFLDLNRRGMSGVKIKMKRELYKGLFSQEN